MSISMENHLKIKSMEAFDYKCRICDSYTSLSTHLSELVSDNLQIPLKV